MIEYEKLFDDVRKRVQIYFTQDSGIYDIRVKCETVDKIIIKDGFLKIHDLYDNCWHCYNLKYVKHFHIPGGLKLS